MAVALSSGATVCFADPGDLIPGPALVALIDELAVTHLHIPPTALSLVPVAELPELAVLTVGGSLTEIVSQSCGVIAIGPFGCMPNRLSEAILNETMTGKEKMATEPQNRQLKAVLADVEDLPFLAIESDGSPFPQLIDAKLETFCLRAERLHKRLIEYQSKSKPH